MTVDDATLEGLGAFEGQRRRMFGIAYRMLGSATDAEDVLQDAWLRWQGVDHARVADPGAFLARVVTNLCLNALTSARATREVYVGPWLPEPVLTGAGHEELGPLDDAVQRENVSFALLAVLERLAPAERAAYVLREAFAYSSREVAEVIGTTEANVRQLHSRARRHVAGAPTRPVDPQDWQVLVGRFLTAARDGDVPGLERLLADGVVSRADGGRSVHAARRAVQGRNNVARYLVGVLRRFADGLVPSFAEVNGVPALLATLDGELRAIWFLRTDGERVTGVDMVLSPEKLAYAARQLSRTAGPAGR